MSYHWPTVHCLTTSGHSSAEERQRLWCLCVGGEHLLLNLRLHPLPSFSVYTSRHILSPVHFPFPHLSVSWPLTATTSHPPVAVLFLFSFSRLSCGPTSQSNPEMTEHWQAQKKAHIHFHQVASRSTLGGEGLSFLVWWGVEFLSFIP